MEFSFSSHTHRVNEVDDERRQDKQPSVKCLSLQEKNQKVDLCHSFTEKHIEEKSQDALGFLKFSRKQQKPLAEPRL